MANKVTITDTKNNVTITPQSNTNINANTTNTPVTVTQDITSIVTVNTPGPQGIKGNPGESPGLNGDIQVRHITASGNISASGRIDGGRIGSFRDTTTFGRTHFELYRPFGSTPEMGRVGALGTGVSTTYNEDKGYRLYLTNMAGGASAGTQHLAVMQNGDVEIDSKSAEQNMNLSGSAKLFVGGNISTNSNITASGNISASGNIITNDVTLSSDGNVNGSSAKIIFEGHGSSDNLQQSNIQLDSFRNDGEQAIVFTNTGAGTNGDRFIMHGANGFFSKRYYMVGNERIHFQQNYQAAEDDDGDTAFTFNNGSAQNTGYLFTVSHQNDPHFRIGSNTGSIELLKPVTASGNISASGNINAANFISDTTLNQTNFGGAFIKSVNTPAQLHLGLGNSTAAVISTQRD